MVVTLGQQYNTGEKSTVMLYTYINRHAGTPDKKKTNKKIVHNEVFCCLFSILFIPSTVQYLLMVFSPTPRRRKHGLSGERNVQFPSGSRRSPRLPAPDRCTQITVEPAVHATPHMHHTPYARGRRQEGKRWLVVLPSSCSHAQVARRTALATPSPNK